MPDYPFTGRVHTSNNARRICDAPDVLSLVPTAVCIFKSTAVQMYAIRARAIYVSYHARRAHDLPPHPHCALHARAWPARVRYVCALMAGRYVGRYSCIVRICLYYS